MPRWAQRLTIGIAKTPWGDLIVDQSFCQDIFNSKPFLKTKSVSISQPSTFHPQHPIKSRGSGGFRTLSSFQDDLWRSLAGFASHVADEKQRCYAKKCQDNGFGTREIKKMLFQSQRDKWVKLYDIINYRYVWIIRVDSSWWLGLMWNNHVHSFSVGRI